MVVPINLTSRPVGAPPREFMDPIQVLHEVDLAEGMTVADFGSGAGFMTIPAAKMVGDTGVVYAVDVQKQLLADVVRKSRLQATLNVKAVWADLEVPGATKIPTASVDVVLLVKVLFQSKKRDAILNEAFRILTPGGKAVLVEWKKVAIPFGPPLTLRVPRDEAERLGEHAGFTITGEFSLDQYHYSVVFTKPGRTPV